MKQLLYLRQVCKNPKSPATKATEPCLMAAIFKKIIAFLLPPTHKSVYKFKCIKHIPSANSEVTGHSINVGTQ